MRRTYSQRLATAAIALFIGTIGLMGCDSINGDGASRMRVFLTDAPVDEMDSVIVTIDRVVLMGDTVDASGLVLMDENLTVDLLTLQNGIDTMLVDEFIPEGDYTQMRLYLTDEATIYLKDGDNNPATVVEQELTVPSGFVRIKLPDFDVNEDDDLIRILLDFDVNDSFVKAGNSGMYLFKPVIHPIEFTIDGEDIDLPAVE